MTSLDTDYKSIIAFDLDDVLCFREDGIEHLGPDKYKFSKPNKSYIDLCNDLYDEGHYIKIYTARGMSQFDGDVEKIEEIIKPITLAHLKEWRVKYHEIIFGKVHYDLLIDDKALNSIDLTKKIILDFLK